MTLQQESTLSFYNKIADISSHKNVVLVQHRDTRQIFVRKDLSVYDKSVYDWLMAHPSRFFPAIYECIESDGQLILIEEYIQGQNLEEYLEERGALPEGETIGIMHHICKALTLLHGMTPPIIHRDLKPSNILLANDGRILLIDFNAARNFNEEKDGDTVIIGTRKYAAPEQYGYAQTDARTDIYALGVILNRMLTGRYPSNETYPGRLGDIIEKCIQFDPAARYQSVDELMGELADNDPAAGIRTGSAANIGNNTAAAHNRKGKTRQQVNHSLLPPGFRTLTWWKMLLSAIYYILLWWFSLTMEVNTYAGAPAAGAALWANRIAVIAVGMLWILLWFNYGHIHGRLPLMKRKKIKWIGYILYTFLIAFAALLTVAIIENLL